MVVSPGAYAFPPVFYVPRSSGRYAVSGSLLGCDCGAAWVRLAGVNAGATVRAGKRFAYLYVFSRFVSF
jgi:hypothetical protein